MSSYSTSQMEKNFLIREQKMYIIYKWVYNYKKEYIIYIFLNTSERIMSKLIKIHTGREISLTRTCRTHYSFELDNITDATYL